MSRTKKGGKGPGHEYWTKRPGSNRHGGTPGKFTKKLTHSLERLEGKKAIKEGLELCPTCDTLQALDGSHYCPRCDEYICDCYCSCK